MPDITALEFFGSSSIKIEIGSKSFDDYDNGSPAEEDYAVTFPSTFTNSFGRIGSIAGAGLNVTIHHTGDPMPVMWSLLYAIFVRYELGFTDASYVDISDVLKVKRRTRVVGGKVQDSFEFTFIDVVDGRSSNTY